MFYELTNNLTLNERVLFKRLTYALIADFDSYDPAMIINTLQGWVLQGGDLANAITPDETKKSLYDKLYEPCMKWLVENHSPECVEAVKPYLEEKHERIQNLDMAKTVEYCHQQNFLVWSRFVKNSSFQTLFNYLKQNGLDKEYTWCQRNEKMKRRYKIAEAA